MSSILKSELASKANLPAHAINLFLIGLIFYLIPCLAEGQNYWANAPTSGTKIFTILFMDIQNGEAVSAEGEMLFTSDKGRNWEIITNQNPAENKVKESFLWKAEIYCSVMQTTNGGQTWIPYDKGKQEHFCGVYLKDQNSGYKIASEFLRKVTNVIFNNYKSDTINSIIDHPQQCTEYYRSMDEGWALGWCVKNFNQESIVDVKVK